MGGVESEKDGEDCKCSCSQYEPWVHVFLFVLWINWVSDDKLLIMDSLRQINLGLCSITIVPSLVTYANFAPIIIN